MIEIIEFTDPVCTWCWGSEPILRKLETRYKDDVKVGFIMGGLVEDMRDFQDELNGIGGELSKVNKQIASHWVEASKRHGMPVQPEGFALFTEEHTSTYPTNIAYKATQLQGQEIADQFLRRIREAVATEAKKANRIDVLKEIAKEVGLDENKWLEQMENGIAKQEFEQDLHLCREFQIYTFPSYLVKDETGKAILLRGFQSYETFQQAIEKLSDGKIKEQNLFAGQDLEQQIKQLLKKYEKMAPIELEMILEVSEKEIERAIEHLLEQNVIQKREAGTGYMISISQEK